MQLVLLEDWWVKGEAQLHGRVYGHPRFEEGFVIDTSKVTSTPMTRDGQKPLYKLATGDVVTTMNTTYILGLHHADVI